MATTFAALIFRPADIPDRALSQGFAVALGGWDVASPRLFIAPLPGVLGHAAAFYSSGDPAGGGDDELDHLAELFEDEPSPPVAVLDAAAELGHPGATVFALVFSEDVVHDDGWRFEASGFVRHFVREGDEGVEAGVEAPDRSDIVEVDVDLPEGATAAEEREAMDRAIRLAPRLDVPRGRAGRPGAGRAHGRPLRARAPRPGAPRRAGAGVDRRRGRAAQPGAPPRKTAAARPRPRRPSAASPWPATYAAFMRAYDWADPADPRTSTASSRSAPSRARCASSARASSSPTTASRGWEAAAARQLYPIARLSGSALGGGAAQRSVVALGADGEQLWVVRGGTERGAGRTGRSASCCATSRWAGRAERRRKTSSGR